MIDFVLTMILVLICPLELQIIFVFLATLFSLIWAQLSVGYLSLWGACEDPLSSSLISLTFLVSLMMKIAWGQNMILKLKNPMSFLILITLLLLTCVFLVKNILFFYALFEASMLPVMIMIYGWGYQPERLKASLYLMFYTVIASLPFLFLIMVLTQEIFSFPQASFLENHGFPTALAGVKTMMLIFCFLVKFPMYFFHLWLPKAHVEAPVSGSIILAAVLLKLGGYGLIRLNTLIVHSDLTSLIQTASLIGGALIGMLCLLQKDLKVLIAYSSVSHMAMVISACMTKLSGALAGSVLMMIAHGLASSGLFAIANISYERSHSRNFLLNMGTLTVIPLLSLFWFGVSLANMGGPPSLNLLSEVILIVSLVKTNTALSCFIVMIAFFSVAYSLILYTIVSQTKNAEASFLFKPLSARETGLSVFHVILFNLSVMLAYLFCF